MNRVSSTLALPQVQFQPSDRHCCCWSGETTERSDCLCHYYWTRGEGDEQAVHSESRKKNRKNVNKIEKCFEKKRKKISKQKEKEGTHHFGCCCNIFWLRRRVVDGWACGSGVGGGFGSRVLERFWHGEGSGNGRRW